MLEYDLVCVGGGIGGGRLAFASAERGAKVLVVERTKAFADRVRGEATHPWGVAELRELGLWATYVSTGAHELPYLVTTIAATRAQSRRHLPSTTRPKLPEVSF